MCLCLGTRCYIWTIQHLYLLNPFVTRRVVEAAKHTHSFHILCRVLGVLGPKIEDYCEQKLQELQSFFTKTIEQVTERLQADLRHSSGRSDQSDEADASTSQEQRLKRFTQKPVHESLYGGRCCPNHGKQYIGWTTGSDRVIWCWSRKVLFFFETIFWLVVWNTFIFPYVGNNHPNWLIFFRRVETNNQFWIV